LAFLKGITEIADHFDEISVPMLLIHGTADRVTSYKATQRLYDMAKSTDKTIKLLEGHEHVLLRRGYDELDDAKRQSVLKIWLDWILARRQ